MPKWIDLRDNINGGKLKAVADNGNSFLLIVGLSEVSERYRKAISLLGFQPSTSGRFLTRPIAPGEQVKAAQFHPVWPNAVLTEMPQENYLVKLRTSASPQEARPTDESRRVTIESSGLRRLGRNADGELVYQSMFGRAIGRANGAIVYENRSLRPEMFLKMDRSSAESLALCADGFVRSMIVGEVQHSNDFDAFCEAIFNAPDAPAEDRALAFSAIEAAIGRYLSVNYDNAQDAYGDSVRLYEYLPPCPDQDRGKGAMPLPLSAIAQRLLGDTTGKTVLYPNAFDGVAFSFLPSGTKVHACKGIKDLSVFNNGLRQPEGVIWSDAYRPAEHKDVDAVFFNSDPGIVEMGSRSDYVDALRVIGSLRQGGRAVLVMAGDSSVGSTGFISEESRSFYKLLSERYDIEDAFELGAELATRVGTSHSLRVISLRNRAPAEGTAPLIAFDVLHSWDEIKSRVDETINRIDLKEAETESVDLARSVKENEYQRPYIAFSKVGEARTMVPKNLQAPLQAAMAQLERLHGPVDRFVEKQIGFGENTLGERFSPEQVDSVGLAIHRFQQGRGFILGDDTGIGKGRQLAALAVWAEKRGQPIVFITDRANLFSDLARDLKDIEEWGRFNPFVMNADGQIIDMFAADGTVLAEGTKPAVMSKMIEESKSLADAGYNILFCTYSQVSNNESLKTKWFLEQTQGALLIIDESHIAAGSDSSISGVISDAVGRAANVCYSSATWAKSAKNLHIYSRAFPESININSLTSAIKSGGDTFVEIFSSMMARDGAMIRREHDLSRIDFSVEADTVRLQRNIEWSDRVSEVLGQMAYVGGEIDKLLMRSNSELLGQLKAARTVGSHMRAGKIFRSSFAAGSAAYITMRRFLSALNAEFAADLAMKAAADNKKPVIVFEDTAETYVEELIKALSVPVSGEQVIKPDEIPAPTIKSLLIRLMNRLGVVVSRNVKERDVNATESPLERRQRKAVEKARLQQAQNMLGMSANPAMRDSTVREGIRGVDDMDFDDNSTDDGQEPPVVVVEQAHQLANANPPALDEEVDILESLNAPIEEDEELIRIDGAEHFSEAEITTYREGMSRILELIQSLPDIPIIPADIVRHRLRSAGLRVGEISGRKFQLDFPEGHDIYDAEGSWRLLPRSKSKQHVNATVRAFNSGAIDALVLNRSAATGISLHASPRFHDTRQRVMVEMQIPENPTDRVQLYGRVNRYDQVISPNIVIATTGIYGERRQLIMQNRKLAEMSANVRSSPDHAAEIKEVRDLLNPIGEEVCRQFLLDNPGIASRIGVSYQAVDEKRVNCSNLLTSRVVLLKTVDQQRIYEELYAMYDDAILRHELAGTNPLRTREHDIRAKTLSETLVMGTDASQFLSAFSGPVYLKQIEWTTRHRIPKFQNVQEMVKQGRQRLVDLGAAVQVGQTSGGMPKISIEGLVNKTVRQIEAIARVGLIGTSFRNIEEALASNSQQANPVRRSWTRKVWLEENLARIVPGAFLEVESRGDLFRLNTDSGVVVGLKPPPSGRESQLASWRVEVLTPYDIKPLSYTLAWLVDNSKLFLERATNTNTATQPAPGQALDPVDPENEPDVDNNGGPRDPEVTIFAGTRVIMNDIFAFGEAMPDEPEVLTRMREKVESIKRRYEHRRYEYESQDKAWTLEGNMYMAAEWASATKEGKPVIYTNDKGFRVRAIKLNERRENIDMSRFLPLRLASANQIAEFLRRVYERDPLLLQPLHLPTSFRSAIGVAENNQYLILRRNSVALTVEKKGMTRVGNSIRSVQRRFIEEDVRKETAAGAEPFNLRRISAHPNYLTIRNEASTTSRSTSSTREITLHFDTPEQMRRAIDLIVQGAGLEIYLTRSSENGQLARSIIEDSYGAEIAAARQRFESANPDSAARLREMEQEMLQARSAPTDEAALAALTQAVQRTEGENDPHEGAERLVA